MVSVAAPPCSLLLSVFFVSSCLCRVVSSLYFHVNQSEVKCFTVEMPNDTQLLGNFGTRLYDAQTNKHLSAPKDLKVLLEVKDPDDQLVLSQASSSDGKFRFTSHGAGVHQICLQPSAVTSDLGPPSAGGTLAIHVDVTVGRGRTNRYAQMTYTRYISTLQLKVLQLTETVKQIQKEQEYQTIRLKRFSDVSHNTEMWIFWWPVVRSLYVVAVITWHTQSW